MNFFFFPFYRKIHWVYSDTSDSFAYSSAVGEASGKSAVADTDSCFACASDNYLDSFAADRILADSCRRAFAAAGYRENLLHAAYAAG